MKAEVFGASAAHISRLPLLHGHSIPRIGFGTWPLTGEECFATVSMSLSAGYRLIDTAFNYGNEVEVGRAVRASGIVRDQLFVSSKFNKEDHSIDGVQRAYDRSLAALGLDYLDMFVCHWPVPQLGMYVEAWKGLVKLLEQGRVLSIGVSNFKPRHVDEIVRATGVVPDVNQIQCSPEVSRTGPRAYHEQLGIVTESWSPIGRDTGLREHPDVLSIAGAVGRSPAQVLVRWHVQHGLIPIPHAARKDWLVENISVFDFSLSQDDMAKLDALDRGEEAARDSDSPLNGH